MRAVLVRMVNHVAESHELSVAKLRLIIACEDEIFSTGDIFIIRYRLRAELRAEIQPVVKNEIIIALHMSSNNIHEKSYKSIQQAL